MLVHLLLPDTHADTPDWPVVMQMEFELPLRQILLAEYDSFANNQSHQHSLPHRPSVSEILSQYVDQSNSEGLDLEQEVWRCA